MRGRLYDFAIAPLEHRAFSGLRDELLAHASGKVLEIGVGTGASLPHYPPGTDVTGLDRDPGMLNVARERPEAERVRLIEGDAEALPFAEGEFDTVVATFVLCSVPHPEKVILEVHRVLKPGGKFLLIEHIRRETRIAGKMQDWLTHPWTHLAGGCHLNRNPERALLDAGFEPQQVRSLWRGFGRMWVLKRV